VAEIEIANRCSIPALATEALFSLPRWTYESPWIVCQKNACVLPGSGVTPEYILAGIDLPAASGARGSLNGSVLPLFEHKSMLATPPTKPQSRFSWFMAHDPGESAIGELMVVKAVSTQRKSSGTSSSLSRSAPTTRVKAISMARNVPLEPGK